MTGFNIGVESARGGSGEDAPESEGIMTKREMVEQIAAETGFAQTDVMEVVQRAFDLMTERLCAGDRMEFRNFGVFEVQTRKSRIGRNPNRPEQTVCIPERKTVKFKPGRIMRQRITGI